MLTAVTTANHFLALQVSDLTLDEGSSLPLTTDIITVANNHFQGMNFLYQVTVPPRFGHLEHSRIPGMPITAFTHTEVRMNECHLRECFPSFDNYSMRPT